MLRLVDLKSGVVMRICALEVDGRCDAQALVESLPRRAQKRLRVVFRLLAEEGRAGRDDTTFKQLESVVWEIKEHSASVRLFCFRYQHRLVVCTHGGKKPAGKARYRRDIEKVLALYRRCGEEGVLP